MVGEILQATIKSQTAEGIVLTVGGNDFMHFWLPVENMTAESTFRRDLGCWIWAYKDSQLIYETGEICRIKVTDLRLVNDCEAVCQSREKGLGMMKWWQ